MPWVVLAGIGEVESNDGRSTLPGVHSGANAFGAAGPMQIGIGGAAGNNWGGAPVHPASDQVAGFATDGNGDGIASVYKRPADAIAGAAKYLVAHGVQNNVSGAIFAYNHLFSYVQSVLHWADLYAHGGFSVAAAAASAANITECLLADTAGGGPGSALVPNQAVASVITSPGRRSASRTVGGHRAVRLRLLRADDDGLPGCGSVAVPRTSGEQWTGGRPCAHGATRGPAISCSCWLRRHLTSPGHVALVIGHGEVLQAYGTGFPIRIASYGTPSSPQGDQTVVGFSRPWAHAGVVLTSQQLAG